ncbi:MAG TPA: hypothetical protein VJN90_05870 [Candidatus Acidoferrales bacterium]|nr:hypothetical protein [Candidatus Acidoferrales bacterium]
MSIHGPLALVGLLVILAGFHLLWQSRREIFFWLETYSKILRASLNQPRREFRRIKFSRFGVGREHVLRLLLGLSLMIVVGPVLIFLGLAF